MGHYFSGRREVPGLNNFDFLVQRILLFWKFPKPAPKAHQKILWSSPLMLIHVNLFIRLYSRGKMAWLAERFSDLVQRTVTQRSVRATRPTLVRWVVLRSSTNQVSTVALTSTSTYFCKENNAEMSLLWNDLAKIPNRFDDVVGMNWFAARKSYTLCFTLQNQIRWKSTKPPFKMDDLMLLVPFPLYSGSKTW